MRKMVFRISTGSTELEYVNYYQILLDTHSLYKHSETLVTETFTSNNLSILYFAANFLEVCSYYHFFPCILLHILAIVIFKVFWLDFILLTLELLQEA